MCGGGLYIPLGVPVAGYPDAPFPGWAPAAQERGPLSPSPPGRPPPPLVAGESDTEEHQLLTSLWMKVGPSCKPALLYNTGSILGPHANCASEKNTGIEV